MVYKICVYNISFNFRAESAALQNVQSYFTEKNGQRPTKAAVFTVCRALPEALQNSKSEQILQEIRKRN